jgi:hypothetical protein
VPGNPVALDASGQHNSGDQDRGRHDDQPDTRGTQRLFQNR